MADKEAQGEFVAALRRARLGEVVHLKDVIRMAGWPPMNNLRVTERSSSVVRLEMWPDFTGIADGQAAPRLRCKVLYQDTGEELAGLRLLQLFNSRWAREKLQLFGVPIRCPEYSAEVLLDGLILLEEPPGVTLGELKRSCGEYTRTRVSDFLCGDPQKLSKLAASCAAMLAASYVLGVSAGDGDTLRLLPDGSLLRTDLVGLFGRGALLDAPPVWLPKAVTCALGGCWSQVQHMASVAFQVVMMTLSPLPPRRVRSWAKAQALLLRMEHLLQLPVTEYLSSLSVPDFQSALLVADDTIGKRVSSVLHDFFGYRPTGSYLDDNRTPEQEAKTQCLMLFLAAEEQEASATSLSLASSLPWVFSCSSWALAVRIVAALCGDAERLLKFHFDDLLLLARQAKHQPEQRQWLQLGALQSLATLVKHSGSEVCGWLAECCSGEADATTYPPAEVFELARILQSANVPSRDGSASSKDAFLLELGAICALARLQLQSSGPRCSALPEAFAELAPLLASEAAAVKRLAAVSVQHLAHCEDDGPSLAGLSLHLSGVDLAAALRCLDHDERFAAVRGLEQEAKAGAEATCRRMARQCLAALAQDEESQVSQPALCAIACAVHDDNEEVRQWARRFLTDASWAPAGGTSDSLHFFVSMLRNMVDIDPKVEDIGRQR